MKLDRKISHGGYLARLVILAVVLLVPSACNRKEEGMIQEGSVVDLEFTLSDPQGDVIQSTKGNDPFTYTHGQGQLIPALEKQLSGMKVGDEKNIQLIPGDAYGNVDPEAFHEIPRDKVPPQGLKVGAILTGTDPQGNPFQARVHQVKEDKVVMDFNHPLAGKALVFDIKIVAIKGADPLLRRGK
jgi:FKBP-type peptidyl-prolyl cis-trans isomerase 2